MGITPSGLIDRLVAVLACDAGLDRAALVIGMRRTSNRGRVKARTAGTVPGAGTTAHQERSRGREPRFVRYKS